MPNGPTDAMSRQKSAEERCMVTKVTVRHKKGTGLVGQVGGLGVPACTHIDGLVALLLYCVPKNIKDCSLSYRVEGGQYRNAIAFILEANGEGGEAGWATDDRPCGRRASEGGSRRAALCSLRITEGAYSA